MERIERETLSKQDVAAMNGATDDWDAGWDEDAQERPDPNQDEDASGWGFDDEEDEPSKEVTDHKDGEDGDDAGAWGWDEDSNVNEERKLTSSLTQHKQTGNGLNGSTAAEQEVTLVEKYTPSLIFQITFSRSSGRTFETRMRSVKIHSLALSSPKSLHWHVDNPIAHVGHVSCNGHNLLRKYSPIW